MESRIKSTEETRYQRDEYFFSNKKWLVGYVRVHHLSSDAQTAYVIDTISARAFGLLSPNYKTIFTENGYESRALDEMDDAPLWMKCLESAIHDIYIKRPNVRIILVLTRESSRERFERQIFRYFSKLPDYIETLSWGWDGIAATFILRNRGI